MKCCKKCNKFIEEGNFCTNCGSSDLSEVNEEPKTKEELKPYREETLCQESIDIIKEDIKGATAFIIIGLIVFLIFGTPNIIAIINLLKYGDIDWSFHIPFIVFESIFTIGGIIFIPLLIKIRIKNKYLLTHGVIIKNLPFETLKGKALLKVQVKYTDEFGNEHIFKGHLPGNAVRENRTCDVLVDRDNYKKYIVRYEY